MHWDAGSTETQGRVQKTKNLEITDLNKMPRCQVQNTVLQVLAYLRTLLKTSAIPGHMIPTPGRAGTQGLPLGWSLGFPEQNIVRREVIFHITFVQKGHTGDNCNRRQNTISHSRPEARAQTACDFFSAEGSTPKGQQVAQLQRALFPPRLIEQRLLGLYSKLPAHCTNYQSITNGHIPTSFLLGMSPFSALRD